MVKHKQLTLHRIIHGIRWRFEHRRWDIIYPLCRRFLPVTNNRICLISWNGTHFNCNPKAIATYLSKYNSDGKYELVAVVDKPKAYTNIYQNIRFVRAYSLQHIISEATCKIFVANIRMFSFHKRQGQYYIQTWHGTGPKKSEKDSIAVLSKEYVEIAIKDCKQTDLMLSGSSYQTNWIKNSTWYEGRILECGSPRYDDFFDITTYNRLKDKVFEKYHISNDSKLVMYAPTFRSLNEIDNFGFNVEKLIKSFKDRFSGNWKLLLRFHPNVATFPLPEIFAKHLSDFVINVTRYDDMQDLLCAADVLITDFSSVSTEFAVQKKPCFLYAPDYAGYDRGLYLVPEQMPFPFAETEEQLLNNIAGFNEESYSLALNKYWDFLGMKEDGKACERVAKEINKIICHHTQE